jgi:hypothetical protein
MKKILPRIGAGLASLVVAGLVACAPGRLLSGAYVQVHKPGSIALEGKILCLADDYTFAYNSWSDNLSSNRYGIGTYQVVGQQLRLSFGVSTPAIASAQMQALVARDDTLVLAFVVRGSSAAGPPVAIPWAVITAYDRADKVVAVASTDVQGLAQLRLPRSAQPQRLRAESLGFISWNQDCATGSTAYQVVLPSNQGTPYAAGTVKEFRVRRVVGRRLLLSQGTTQIAFKRQPAGH